MEKTIQTLKLDTKGLIEELKEIHYRNINIRERLLKANEKNDIEKALEAFNKSNRRLIKVITILEYLEELEK